MIEYLLVLLILLMPALARLGGSGLVHQVGLTQDVALGTLAGNTPLAIETSFNTITAGFLIKRVRYGIQAAGVTVGQGPLYVGLARGDATVAEIINGMQESNTSGPQDTTQMRTQTDSWIVLQNSLEQLKVRGDGTVHEASYNWISFGKGIPYSESAGFQAFIYNADGTALATGGVVNGQIDYQGVWLGS